MCEICGTQICLFSPVEDIVSSGPLSITSTTSSPADGLALSDRSDIDAAIAALLSPWSWSDADIAGGLTFGFSESPADYAAGATYYGEETAFLTLGATGLDMMRTAFSGWSGVMRPDLTERTAGPLIAVGGTGVAMTAWAYLPYTAPNGGDGDIWIGVDKSWNALFATDQPKAYVGSYEYLVGMHEVGHSLGLKHPHTGFRADGADVMAPEFDALEYSVMSYRSFVGAAAGAYTVRAGEFPQSLMMLDIAAIQALYGADYTTLAGATTYRFDPSSGDMHVDGVSAGATKANVVFRTLWDGGGVDLIDLSAYTTDISANLAPGGAIVLDSRGFAQRSFLGQYDGVAYHAGANIYMSLLHDGDTRSLIEDIVTGAGNDVIAGNSADNVIATGDGDDIVKGGSGIDTVRLSVAAPAVSVARADGGLTLYHAGGSVALESVEAVETLDDSILVADLMAALAAFGDGEAVTLSEALSPPPAAAGSISGTVYVDADGDGLFSAGDTGLADWTVFIDADGDGFRDAGETSVLTDAAGRYRFDEIGEGRHGIALDMKPGYARPAESGAGGPLAWVTMGDQGGTVAADLAVIRSPSRPVIAEFGMVQGVDHGWSHVALARPFENPVVFAFVSTSNGSDIVSPRIADVTAQGFDVMLAESADLDGIHVEETVSYVVMEAGLWALADGRVLEVGTTVTNQLSSGPFADVGFAADFADRPEVFMTVQTFNEAGYLTARGDGLSASGFSMALEEEEATNRGSHAEETVGWFAIGGGLSTIDDLVFEIGNVAPDHRGTSVTLQGDHAADVGLLATVNGFGGNNPVTARAADVASDGAVLYLQEDRSADSETRHKTEPVSYMAFSGQGLLTGYDISDTPTV